MAMSWEAITAICAVLSIIGGLGIFILNLTVKEQLGRFRLETEKALENFRRENDIAIDREIALVNAHLKEIEKFTHERVHYLSTLVMNVLGIKDPKPHFDSDLK